MVYISQYALRMHPAWRVSADMSSLIDPNGTIAAYSGGGQFEPVNLQILTPYSFDYMTPVPANATFTNTGTKTAPKIIRTSTPTSAPAIVPSQTSTDRPTDTRTPTKTRVVIYYTPSFTPTETDEVPPTLTYTSSQTFTPSRTLSPTRTATATRTYSPTTTFTATRTSTHTRTLTSTQTSTFTRSSTPTITFTPTQTYTPTITYTSTNTPTPSHTFTPTYTPTPTVTFTPTETFTPTLTFTPTETFTPSLTFTPTNTFTFTPTIVMPNCSNNRRGDINLGPGDGICTTIFTGNTLNISLGANPIKLHGDSGWDFIFYERAAHPGILMDFITIEISADNNTWYTVFAYGGNLYSNSSIAGYPQNDNEPIPLSAPLYGSSPAQTGIGIDIDDPLLNGGLGIPDDDYQFLRITAPLGDSGDGCDVDAFEVYP
jgi:hypothetical protein